MYFFILWMNLFTHYQKLTDIDNDNILVREFIQKLSLPLYVQCTYNITIFNDILPLILYMIFNKVKHPIYSKSH